MNFDKLNEKIDKIDKRINTVIVLSWIAVILLNVVVIWSVLR